MTAATSGRYKLKPLKAGSIPSNRVRRFQKDLLAWFEREGRHFPWRNRSATTYQLVISEVLLQRTRAETVERFFPHFIATFPSWKSLANASDSDLREFLQPIGLWRRRAASITALAREVNERHGRVPTVRSEIESLPGVGQYIANAIVLLAHDGREPLLDVNMARVLERYFGPRQLADIRYDTYLQSLSKRIVDHKEAKRINWAVLDLGAKVCKARSPHCIECPMEIRCKHAKGGTRQVTP